MVNLELSAAIVAGIWGAVYALRGSLSTLNVSVLKLETAIKDLGKSQDKHIEHDEEVHHNMRELHRDTIRRIRYMESLLHVDPESISGGKKEEERENDAE